VPVEEEEEEEEEEEVEEEEEEEEEECFSFSFSVKQCCTVHHLLKYYEKLHNEQDGQSGKIPDSLFESYPFQISTSNTEYCD
jgi:hypothetical protein